MSLQVHSNAERVQGTTVRHETALSSISEAAKLCSSGCSELEVSLLPALVQL